VHGGRSIFELLDRHRAGQAVPNLEESGSGPLSCEFSQPSLVAEGLCIRDGFGILNSRVNGDLVGLFVEGKRLHDFHPLAAVAVVTTFMPLIDGTGKRISRKMCGEAETPIAARTLMCSEIPR
jgi:hypothetical protein